MFLYYKNKAGGDIFQKKGTNYFVKYITLLK